MTLGLSRHSVVFALFLIVVGKVEIIRIEPVDFFNYHALQILHGHVTVAVSIHGHLDFCYVEPLLLWQADVIEVRIL